MNIASRLEKEITNLKILSRYIDRIAYASDASFYHLIPEVVVQPETIDQIVSLLSFARNNNIHLTFRAAGTSLSGQAVTDGILVDLSKGWKKYEVINNGKQIRLEPGIIGQQANNLLRNYSKKIGPDPASIGACMLGGMIANNASGMCCGVIQNSYHTLSSVKFILPTGNVFDTAAPDAEEEFNKKEPKIAKGLQNLREQILNNKELTEKIRSKYKIKNTTGYSINAFIDFEKSVEIMAHLLVGSEGTLGFIAEVVLNTVSDPKHKYTGLLLFPNLQEAGKAIGPLSAAQAIEIMDYPSLKAISGMHDYIKAAPVGAACLLVEYQSETEEEIIDIKEQLKSILKNLSLIAEADFTSDSKKQLEYWKIRKGLFPAVGATKPQGATVIIEDIAVAVKDLPEAISDLQMLYAKYQYHNAITFGHAKDGNLHFVITPVFSSAEEKTRYANFMYDLVQLITIKYQGSLKAEHGTGRNIAPFVEMEWGKVAYQIMKELKTLIDPRNILNPGVIINPNPECFISNIKDLPIVEEEVDQCIECGFCEPKCPSRNLTLSPRQRIVVRREMARLKDKSSSVFLELKNDYQYDGLDTCAADSLCELACPVKIDTGALVKRLRNESLSDFSNKLASVLARNFSLTQNLIRISLTIGHFAERLFGKRFLLIISKLLGFPQWISPMPKARWLGTETSSLKKDFVYFPSCISRTMSYPDDDFDIVKSLIEVSKKAGFCLFVPSEINSTCCGTPFSSKGYNQANKEILKDTINRCWQWSEGGRYPIVCDTSPCSYSLKTCSKHLEKGEQEKWQKMQFLDLIEFLHDYLLPKLELKLLNKNIIAHPVCSVEKMGLTEKLSAILHSCSKEVTIPINSSCCGFAGDRGFSHPELTSSALETEAQEINSKDYDYYLSSSFTCELGLSRKTNKDFKSILKLLMECS